MLFPVFMFAEGTCIRICQRNPLSVSAKEYNTTPAEASTPYRSDNLNLSVGYPIPGQLYPRWFLWGLKITRRTSRRKRSRHFGDCSAGADDEKRKCCCCSIKASSAPHRQIRSRRCSINWISGWNIICSLIWNWQENIYFSDHTFVFSVSPFHQGIYRSFR